MKPVLALNKPLGDVVAPSYFAITQGFQGNLDLCHGICLVGISSDGPSAISGGFSGVGLTCAGLPCSIPSIG